MKDEPAEAAPKPIPSAPATPVINELPWVESAGLTLCQLLLVYPDQRTSIDCGGPVPGVRTSFGIFVMKRQIEGPHLCGGG